VIPLGLRFTIQAVSKTDIVPELAGATWTVMPHATITVPFCGFRSRPLSNNSKQVRVGVCQALHFGTFCIPEVFYSKGGGEGGGK